MVGAIRANNWRQGGLFPESAHDALTSYAGQPLAADDCCIVISQSCDIVSPDIESEPLVEVVLARKLSGALDGNYTHAKNARRLHIDIQAAGSLVPYAAEIRWRFSVPRKILGQHQPDMTRWLDRANLQDVLHWIVSRYQRHAFPDAFNLRTERVIDRKIKKILKRIPKLTALYAALNTWDELGKGDSYEIDLVGTVRPQDHEDPKIRTELETALSQIANAFNSCDGITAGEFHLRSESEMTLDDVRVLSRVNFDYISLGSLEHDMPAS